MAPNMHASDVMNSIVLHIQFDREHCQPYCFPESILLNFFKGFKFFNFLASSPPSHHSSYLPIIVGLALPHTTSLTRKGCNCAAVCACRSNPRSDSFAEPKALCATFACPTHTEPYRACSLPGWWKKYVDEIIPKYMRRATPEYR